MCPTGPMNLTFLDMGMYQTEWATEIIAQHQVW